jgi:hypothetical protein
MERLMTTKVQALTLLTLGAALLVAPAQTTQTTQTAQAAAGAPTPPTLSATEQTIYDIKNPVPWLNWGLDLRVRNEYFNSLLTLNPNANLHQQDYFRFRGRLWASITPVEDLSLNARLAAEPREWMMPAGYTPYKGNSGLDWREGIIDNLNVVWRNVGGMPMTIKAGRQDLFLGDGWLLGDGTPIDGSWTYYLDSARVTYDFKDQHTVIDAIGIVQSARDDAWLPTINPNHLLVTEQDEDGVILQVANSSMKSANLTGYFIWKNDTLVAANGNNADIYTLGGRINGPLNDHWKYWVEGAYQFGQKQDPTLQHSDEGAAAANFYHHISAYGVNSKLSYLFKDELNNQLAMSFEMLSGDNPHTGNDEMFDVLWGRWPHWSEIGLYSYAAETRIGQEANLIRFGPTWTVNPIKDMEFTASYYALFAMSDVPTREASTTLFSNSDNFRGHFASGILRYKFGPHMNGSLWSEFLIPGSYYAYHELIPFLRAEVMFTF